MERYTVVMSFPQGWEVHTTETCRTIVTTGHGTGQLNMADDVCNELNRLVTQAEKTRTELEAIRDLLIGK
jgi:hypothetical protein